MSIDICGPHTPRKSRDVRNNTIIAHMSFSCDQMIARPSSYKGKTDKSSLGVHKYSVPHRNMVLTLIWKVSSKHIETSLTLGLKCLHKYTSVLMKNNCEPLLKLHRSYSNRFFCSQARIITFTIVWLPLLNVSNIYFVAIPNKTSR